MHVEERALRREIFAHPEEDGPRLAYADWLEERGDARGEFIRIQCELAASPPAKRGKALRERQAQLLEEHRKEWVELISRRCRGIEFHRGFVERVTMSVEIFVEHGLTMVHLEPISEVSLRGGKRAMKELSECMALGRLKWLEFDGNLYNDDHITTLFSTPHLEKLTSLRLHKHDFQSAGAQAISECPSLNNLQSLEIANVAIGDAGVAAIAASSRFSSLSSLILTYCRIGDEGVVRLAASPHLTRLKTLNLNDNHHTRQFSDDGVERLAASPILSSIESLSLSYCHIGNRSLAALAASPYCQNLKSLNLSFNAVTDAGLGALAQSPLLERLEKLHLAHNLIADAGIDALLNSPYWTRKTKLYLRRNLISQKKIASLREEYGKTFGNF